MSVCDYRMQEKKSAFYEKIYYKFEKKKLYRGLILTKNSRK